MIQETLSPPPPPHAQVLYTKQEGWHTQKKHSKKRTSYDGVLEVVGNSAQLLDMKVHCICSSFVSKHDALFLLILICVCSLPAG